MSAPDEFTSRILTGIQISTLPSIAEPSLDSLEARLENWSRVVRTSGNRDRACALWAKWYVTLRDVRTGDMPAGLDRDELDGWRIEEAWKLIPHPVHKWLLQFHYIFRMSPAQIQVRLWKKHHVRLRGHQFEVAMANARQAMSHSLNRIQRR